MASRSPLAFLASFLLLAASLVNFLMYDKYPMLRPEIFAAFLALALFCAMMAFIYARVGIWGRRLLDVLLIAFVIDLNVDNGWWPVLGACAYFLISLRLKEAPHQFLAIFGGFVMISSIIGIGERQPWLSETKPAQKDGTVASNRPAIIHILLDEHIGVGGFHKTESGMRTAAQLREFYTRNGFAVYGKAYSQHLHTVNAVPHILNFGAKQADAAGRQGATIGRNAHFNRLEALGYKLNIYQSDFADFCSGYSNARCISYANSSMQPLLAYDMSIADRTALILSKFIGMSQGSDYVGRKLSFLDVISARAGLPGFYAFLRLKETGTAAALEALEHFARDLESARPGEAYFMHSLFPHYPYVTQANCNRKPLSEWKNRKDFIPLTDRANAYDEQISCSILQIELLLKALEKSPAANNYVMILHGDHGSRLTVLDPIYERRGKFRSSDLIASFSTLFAVRISGGEGRYSEGMASAASLLQQFSARDYLTAPVPLTNSQPYIFIDDRDWKPRSKEPLPTQW